MGQSTTKSTKNNPPVLLRCFCNCSELTWDQVKLYSKMNVNELLHSAEATKLLKSFLEIGRQADQSEVMISILCYELSEQLKNTATSERTVEKYDELRDLCPSYVWEQRLDDAIIAEQNGDSNAIDEYFLHLMKDCRSNIEIHPDYERFKRELLRKLGR